MSGERPSQKEVLRALLLAADQPLSVRRIEDILAEDGPVTKLEIRGLLNDLRDEIEGSAVELTEVASGFRLQLRREFAPWVSRLWQEKAAKYSRAFLETLALICYRQPITRGEIEEIRGVSLSGSILRTMMERGWVREVGHREGPGRPALLATTREFLDDFNLRSIEDLPPLAELSDPEKLEQALDKMGPPAVGQDEEEQAEEADDDERDDDGQGGAAQDDADQDDLAPAEAAQDEAAQDDLGQDEPAHDDEGQGDEGADLRLQSESVDEGEAAADQTPPTGQELDESIEVQSAEAGDDESFAPDRPAAASEPAIDDDEPVGFDEVDDRSASGV